MDPLGNDVLRLRQKAGDRFLQDFLLFKAPLRVSVRATTQTPGRIQKVDPLMGVPIKYP